MSQAPKGFRPVPVTGIAELRQRAEKAEAEVASERSARIRAEARVAELLGALKPFADHPNGNGVVGDNEFRDPWLTFGDFRRARSITTGER